MKPQCKYNSIIAGLPKPFRMINVMDAFPGFEMDFHKHDYYHVNYVTDGSLSVWIAEKKYDIDKWHAFFLPPDIPHKIRSESGYSQIGTDIFPDSGGLAGLIGECCGGNMLVTEKYTVYVGYAEMRRRIINPTKLNMRLITNIAENILLRAMGSSVRPERADFADKFRAMTENYDPCELSLDAMCSILGYSRTHLERLALEEFGCGAVEYCNRLRLSRVCMLLQTTGLSLQEIAEQSRCCDASHLSVFFKRRTGMTPGEYRRHCR